MLPHDMILTHHHHHHHRRHHRRQSLLRRPPQKRRHPPRGHHQIPPPLRRSRSRRSLRCPRPPLGHHHRGPLPRRILPCVVGSCDGRFDSRAGFKCDDVVGVLRVGCLQCGHVLFAFAYFFIQLSTTAVLYNNIFQPVLVYRQLLLILSHTHHYIYTQTSVIMWHFPEIIPYMTSDTVSHPVFTNYNMAYKNWSYCCCRGWGGIYCRLQ